MSLIYWKLLRELTMFKFIFIILMQALLRAENDGIVGIPTEECRGIVIICIAVCLGAVSLVHYVRVVHLPLVLGAGGGVAAAGGPAAVLVSVELHAGGVVGNHLSSLAVHGQLGRAHTVDIHHAFWASAPVLVMVALRLVEGLEPVHQGNIKPVLVVAVEGELCECDR